MKRYNKTSLIKRTGSILRDNEGTSLLLVAVIAILIITGVVILRMTTTTLWAAADKQQYKDQAYVMATSLGDSLDQLIVDDKEIDLAAIYASDDKALFTDNASAGDCNGTVTAVVGKRGENYVVTVTAKVANEQYEYVYTATYSGSGTSYTRVY